MVQACDICFLNLFIWPCWVFTEAFDLSIVACEIQFPNQGSNPGLLHWEHSLSHWASREVLLFISNLMLLLI